jgi:D-aminopeptidase
VLNFDETPYLANIGDAASMKEALELSGKIVTVAVKDKAKGWEPSPEETYPLIYAGTMKALEQAAQAEVPVFNLPLEFSMEVCDGFVFDTSQTISWKGAVSKEKAEWTAPSIEIGLELFHSVRELILKL